MSKLNIKKIAALGCAAAMLSSLTACGEKTTWGAVIDGVQIPAGVFIYYLETAHYEAQQKLSEQQAAASSDLSPEGAAAQSSETVALPLFSSQIDGVDAKQWIYDEATRSMQEYAAVEAKFDEYGLTLTDEEKESAQVYMDQMWEYAGDYYTSMGISQNSYKSIFLNSSKKQKLFETLYSEGGERAVSDDELKAYLDENYALINYIEVELRDGEGNLLKSEGKAERMDMLNGYIERYKNGEDFDKLNAEYVTYYEGLKKAAEEAAAAAAAEAAANAETAPAADETAASEEVAVVTEVSESPAQAPLAGEGDELEDSDEEAPAETEAPAEEETAEETAAPEASETAPETSEAAVSETAASETASVTEETQNAAAAEVDSNMTAIEKSDMTVPCPEVAQKVFGSMNKGDIEIVETADGEYYYLVVKLDILEDAAYFASARASLLSEMKYDEFGDIVTEWTAAQSVSKNDAAYKRYDPEKLFSE